MSGELLVERLGNYEPLLALARGGMGTVYVARQLGAAGFERLVALKRVHAHLLDNREFRDLFRDEARLSSLVRHPNVVSATDVVEWSNELFLVMDYVEGTSLSALQRGGEPIEPAIASRIMCDALSGLHAAHEAVDMHGNRLDIIHRDVSPPNLLVGVDGISRIIDFGVAKASARLVETTGVTLKGKLRYMAPEQVSQKAIDRRVDVFAAGVVLYEVLTGERLFRGDDQGEIALAILVGDRTPPSRRASGISPALDAVVLRALASSRRERFSTAAEMQAALELACPPASTHAVAVWMNERAGPMLQERRAALSVAIKSQRVPTVATVVAEPSAKRSRRVLALASAALLVVAAIAMTTAGKWTRSADVLAAPSPSGAPAIDAPEASLANANAQASAMPVEPPSAIPLAPPSASGRAKVRKGNGLHRNPYDR